MARACVIFYTSMNLASILLQNNRYDYPPTAENQLNALLADLSVLAHRCDNAIYNKWKIREPRYDGGTQHGFVKEDGLGLSSLNPCKTSCRQDPVGSVCGRILLTHSFPLRWVGAWRETCLSSKRKRKRKQQCNDANLEPRFTI